MGFSSARWKEVKASVKYLEIYGKREKYPIQTMCQFFGVSRSGYYDYIKRMDKPDRAGGDSPVSGAQPEDLRLPTGAAMA